MRVVYDCSAWGAKDAPSLNDCLEPGPPLKNKIYDVLVRGRFHSVAFAGDSRQAFLQVHIREGECDARRFQWLRDLHSTQVQVFRFTKALFWLAASPFLLGGVIEQHLESWRERLPQSVAEILCSLYVDDLISGELEENPRDFINYSEDTYTKQQLSANVSGVGTKLLGLKWDEVADTPAITFPQERAEPTKRGILGKLGCIYDYLGLASPTTLQGEFIYREACELKQAWDAPLPDALAVRWKRWESASNRNWKMKL
ncbi:uncharacterized protein [Montipora foliosa]|uniref:uncharacterized protein n=1 Tax=Montipora foliosa TaxID=591990 RepID=UPI0035F1DC82